ncbi:MAG: GDP-mannose 4,6-dehydratase, partial [Phycisphaeraceae bacterium]|nr:GDP-mannose 4,6-dehydratase [Phycisphaeraceae bacterium]
MMALVGLSGIVINDSIILVSTIDERLGRGEPMDEAIADGTRDRLRAVIVRLFNTIGLRQVGRYGMVVPRFVDAAVKGEPLTVYGDGSQTRCFIDVRDTVRALVTLMDDATHTGELFNIGSNRELTIDQLADRVIALAGSDSEKQYVPFDQVYSPQFEDMQRRVPSVDKLRSATGFEPKYAIDDTLTELIAVARADS